LINTGFPRFFPKYLRNSDNKAINALRQYETRDFYNARDTAAEVLNEYRTLLIGAKVLYARQDVIRSGFTSYNSSDFNRADEAAQKAVIEYEAGKIEAAINYAEEALLRYNILLIN